MAAARQVAPGPYSSTRGPSPGAASAGPPPRTVRRATPRSPCTSGSPPAGRSGPRRGWCCAVPRCRGRHGSPLRAGPWNPSSVRVMDLRCHRVSSTSPSSTLISVTLSASPAASRWSARVSAASASARESPSGSDRSRTNTQCGDVGNRGVTAGPKPPRLAPPGTGVVSRPASAAAAGHTQRGGEEECTSASRARRHPGRLCRPHLSPAGGGALVHHPPDRDRLRRRHRCLCGAGERSRSDRARRLGSAPPCRTAPVRDVRLWFSEGQDT
jgi:hypothetical protein